MKSVVTAALAMLVFPAQAATPVTGKWLTTERDSIIEIGTCGNTVCGKVARVLKMAPDGSMPVDSNNPNPAMRNRPIQGSMILTGFTDGGKVWNGRIYDPRAGKTYKSKLTRNPDGSLNVEGCVAFICRKFTWTPAK